MFEYKLDSMRRAMQAPDTPEDSESRILRSKNLAEAQHAIEISAKYNENSAIKQVDPPTEQNPKTVANGESSNEAVQDQVRNKESVIETTNQGEDEFGDIDIEINFDDGDNEE